MCGIIAIVSREPARPTPTRGRAARRSRPGDRVRSVIRRPSPRRSRRSTRPCTACPGVLALADRHDLVAGLTTRLDQLDEYATAGRRRPGRGAPPPSRTRSRRRTPRRSGCATLLWAIRRDRLRTVARGRRPVRSRCVGAGPSGLPRDPAGAVGDRPDGGARSRLGRHPRVRVAPRARSRRPRASPTTSPPAAATRCSSRVRPAPCRTDRRPCCRSCTRRRRRSASWATTRRRCGPPSAGTACCAWR